MEENWRPPPQMESSNSTWTEYNQGREDDNQRRLAREQDLPGYILENTVCKEGNGILRQRKPDYRNRQGHQIKEDLVCNNMESYSINMEIH